MNKLQPCYVCLTMKQFNGDKCKRCEEREIEEKEKKNCCKKCFDVHYEKTYPAHTPYYFCTNNDCDCHKEPSNKLK